MLDGKKKGIENEYVFRNLDIFCIRSHAFDETYMD